MIKLPKLPSYSKWSRKERLLVAVAAGVIGLLVFDRMVITAWWQRVIAMRAEIQDVEQKLQNERRLAGRKPSVIAETESYRRYLQPGDGKELVTATLLEEVEELAQQSQVTLEEVKPLVSGENDLYQEYAFEVYVRCSMDQWVRFVHLIESSESLFEVDKAKVEAGEAATPDQLKGFLLLKAVSLRKA